MSNLFACLDSDNDEPVAKPVAKPVGKDATKPTAAGTKTTTNGNDKNAGKTPAAAKPAGAAGPKKGTNVISCAVKFGYYFLFFIIFRCFVFDQLYGESIFLFHTHDLMWGYYSFRWTQD